jgi:PKD repeat protein
MDYYSGSCASVMITLQQVARMHFTLDNYRSNLWQPTNLAATGVNDTINAAVTVPIAAFSVLGNQNLTDVRTCLNTSILYKDNSYNGTITKWEWDFGAGASPATFIGQTPTAVTYTTPGYKTVTLKVTGANGSNTKVGTNYIYIEGPNDVKQGSVHRADWDYSNDFLQDGWHFENEVPVGGWIRTTEAYYDGFASMELPSNNKLTAFNYSLISPTYNFTGASTPYFQFYYAFASNFAAAPATAPTQDALTVMISTDCGKTWTGPKARVGGSAYETNAIPSQNGTDLTTNTMSTIAGNASVLNTFPFVPSNATQWKKMLVSSSQIPTQANVKFKIMYSNGGGNNLFIDNVILGLATGINDLTIDDVKIGVHPNPFSTTTTLIYNLPLKAKVDVKIFDIVGKEVGQIFSGTQDIGGQELTIDRTKLNLTNGLYFVKMIVGDSKEFTQKIVIN